MSDNNNPIYQIIDSKVIDYAEIVVILFEQCNLQCLMCSQDHDSTDNLDKKDILSKVDYISNWINENNKSKYFKLHIMGGEVFQDRLINNGYLDIYDEFMQEVQNRVVDQTKDITFNYVSNLVFENTEPVLKFIDKEHVILSTSYDSSGRFSKSEFEIFKNNIEIFKKHIAMVSCVMTAPSMKAVVKDEYFKYLYDNFLVDWDSFWPIKEDNINRFLMPTETETYEFYKWLVDNHPKCLNVEHFTTTKTNMKMTCTRGNNTTILQDNSVPKGCSGSAYVVDRKTSDDDVSEVMTNFFEKYSCFTCPYFARCPFTCFIKADYRYIEDDLDDCVFRKTFQYVEEKKSLAL